MREGEEKGGRRQGTNGGREREWMAAGRRWGGNYSKIRLDCIVQGWKSVREALNTR
jgi:hypothetical protein